MAANDNLKNRRQDIFNLVSDFEQFVQKQLERENIIIADFYKSLSKNKIKRIRDEITDL